MVYALDYSLVYAMDYSLVYAMEPTASSNAQKSTSRPSFTDTAQW